MTMEMALLWIIGIVEVAFAVILVGIAQYVTKGKDSSSKYDQRNPDMICSHCGARRLGHLDGYLRCPCKWADDRVMFFKPIKAEAWFERELGI